MTVLLPPGVGGLTAAGTLGDAEGYPQLDVADEWYVDDSKTERRRVRVWNGDSDRAVEIAGMRLVRSFILNTESNGEAPVDEDDETRSREWRWYVRPRSAEDDGSKMAMLRQKLDRHNLAVGKTALAIADAAGLDGDLRNALAMAGRHHDDGKGRKLWQLSIGNRDPNLVLAKSGNARAPDIRVDYRHELGSLLDVRDEPEFKALPVDLQEFVLHLIAAHHGRARPCFDATETFDPERTDEEVREIVREVPRRFARLQKRYGRWGLAYLESLLRAADAYVSANGTEGACD
jgi:CRISPR-associated endonuclease/helicase Cas3